MSVKDEKKPHSRRQDLFDLLFSKISGETFGFLAGGIGLGAILLASLLYYIEHPFNFFTLWISNLGIGPNGSDIVFKAALIISPIFYVIFCIAYARWTRKANKITHFLSDISSILSVITAIALMIVGIVDMESNQRVHGTAAVIFFGGLALVSCLFTINLHINKEGSIIIWFMTVIMVAMVSGFIPLLNYTAQLFYAPDIPAADITMQAVIDMLGDMDPTLDWIRFIEWCGSILAFVWIFIAAIHYKLNYAKSLSKNTKNEKTSASITNSNDQINTNEILIEEQIVKK